MNTFSASQTDISKIAPLSADSSPSMSGRQAGFLTLLTKYVSHPLCLLLHCSSRDSAGVTRKIIKIVIEVVNFTVQLVLNKMKFKLLLKGFD
jgi:hypothetical protein